MTVIVGVTDSSGAWIGADSYHGSNGTYWRQHESKVFRRGPFVIGVAGESRFAQILRYQLNAPPRRIGRDAYMCGPFVDALREVLKSAGYAKTESSQENWDNVAALVAFEGRLWSMWGDLQIGPVRQYQAVGAGQDVALGALHATRSLRPGDRVVAALKAAGDHCAYVCPPYKTEFQSR